MKLKKLKVNCLIIKYKQIKLWHLSLKLSFKGLKTHKNQFILKILKLTIKCHKKEFKSRFL